MSHDASVASLLAAHGLGPDTVLYREAVFTDLLPGDSADRFVLRANRAPADSIVDVYGAGHVVLAESVGQGLAFAETSRPNWQETMEMRAIRGDAGGMPEARVEVSVLLGDILAQGGRVYPVESVTVERAWYCTLPAGQVMVRIVA